uniref:Immunoglobulin heavy variable 8-1 n=1 Tax=Cyprinus carpio TaxID=7962 RepID=A0A8C1U9K1_CYPCA
MFPAVNCIELNQPPLMVIKPGESFSIGCKITGYSASGGGCTNWIRPSAGKALEWIGWFCSSGNIGTGDTMKNKISFTAETSSNTVFLRGQSFQTEDTAVYYCARNTQ